MLLRGYEVSNRCFVPCSVFVGAHDFIGDSFIPLGTLAVLLAAIW